MSEKQFELTVTVVKETPGAILIDDGSVKAWIPRSQLLEPVEKDSEGCIVEISIPEWLAIDKELV